MIISPLIWFVAKDLDEGISTTYYCIVECNDEQLTTASLYYKKQIIPFTDSVSVENAENLWQMSEKFVTKYHENKK